MYVQNLSGTAHATEHYVTERVLSITLKLYTAVRVVTISRTLSYVTTSMRSTRSVASQSECTQAQATHGVGNHPLGGAAGGKPAQPFFSLQGRLL